MTSTVLVSLILLVVGMSSILVRLIRSASWLAATAEVIALGRPYSPTDDSRVDATMLPTIKFTTATGAIVIFEDKKLRLGPAIVGESLEILYAPSDPRKIDPRSIRRRFKLEFIPILIGLFFLCCALVG